MNLKKAQEQQKKQYDLKHVGPFYSIGDQVIRKTMRRETRQGDKLIARWNGPFEIAETLGKGSYRIKKPNGEILKQRIASTRLKRFHPAEAEESDDPEKEAPTIKRMKENDDDDDSLSLLATESGHKAVFRPITTATIQSITQNRQLAFKRLQKNILEMIGNKTEVQYLPIETKPQVSDVIKVRDSEETEIVSSDVFILLELKLTTRSCGKRLWTT